jgi:NADH:ubiquinone oxidoreductase subunit 6 (subunit J)
MTAVIHRVFTDTQESDPYMSDRFSWATRKYFVFAMFFAAALIMTSGESITMSISASGAYKIVAYTLAVGLMVIAGLGINLIREAISEDSFIQNRRSKMITGIALFSLGIFLSAAGSTHNIHYRTSNEKLQIADLESVYRDLSTAKVNLDSNINQIVDQYKNKTNALLNAVIKECKNQDNPGCGSVYQDRKRELDQHLQVEIPFISPRDNNTKPNEYAIVEFQKSVRVAMEAVIGTIKSRANELKGVFDDQQFNELLKQLKQAIDEYHDEDSEKTVRLLKRAYAQRQDVQAHLQIVAKALQQYAESSESSKDTVQQRGNSTTAVDTPFSTQMRNVAKFWSAVIEKESPLKKGDVLWSILFGIVFEVAFTAFYIKSTEQPDLY